MISTASGIEAAVNSGAYESSPHTRPRVIQMVLSPALIPPAMSAAGESPTIQPSSANPHCLAAFSKMAKSGFHDPTTDEMETASNSASIPAASNFAH